MLFMSIPYILIDPIYDETMRRKLGKGKKVLACPRRSQVFTIAQVGARRAFGLAGVTESDAIRRAEVDPDDKLSLWEVCARSKEEAQVLHAAGKSILVKKA